jgi:hypothetical protein
MKTAGKFLGPGGAAEPGPLLLGWPLERLFIFGPLFGAIEASGGYFNTQFTRFGWATSFFYNFMMWLTAAGVFHLAHPRLAGGWLARSLKIYGLMFLCFASVSAIYMNYYSHPKDLYLYNILDGVIAFGVVALANAFFYPRLMK